MLTVDLRDVEGVRCVPDRPSATAALVIAGSSGRVDIARAQVLATHGVTAESIRWFGGDGQHDGPWEIPLELFVGRVTALRRTHDRVVVVGTSFGAEAALLTGALSSEVDAVVALAPTDVVWAGITTDGRVTSHWTYLGTPLPYVPFTDRWSPDADPPEFAGLYESSRRRYPAEVAAAAIPVERIAHLVLVAGGDDRVWPSAAQSEAIRRRRAVHGLPTTVVLDPEAGHRAILPGESVVTGGVRMQRGGTESADRRLGRSAWEHVLALLPGPSGS